MRSVATEPGRLNAPEIGFTRRDNCPPYRRASEIAFRKLRDSNSTEYGF